MSDKHLPKTANVLRRQQQAPEAQPAPAPPGTVTLVANAKQPKKANAVVYSIPGLRGTIRFVRTLFAGPAPATLTVAGVSFAAPVPPKPKLTPAERKALRAAMTPAQRVAEARTRVDAAIARATRLEAALQASK
jgi:hypothetical protein